eukprot:m.90414 g.90414  ORF g.90414 m.90414 type:complete len:84 (-) comp11843_c0_seq1:139-390(-)
MTVRTPLSSHQNGSESGAHHCVRPTTRQPRMRYHNLLFKALEVDTATIIGRNTLEVRFKTASAANTASISWKGETTAPYSTVF